MKKIKRVGRKPVLIRDNAFLSRVIYAVSREINYPKKIAEETNIKEFVAISQRMVLLKKKNYLFSLKETQGIVLQSNITLYEVNWNKILEEYLSYCLDIYESEEIKFSDYEKLEIVGSAYLRLLIECFCVTEPLTRNSTLTSIFERTNDFILARDKIVRDLESQNNSMKKFIQLLREIGADSLTKQEDFVIKKYTELFLNAKD